MNQPPYPCRDGDHAVLGPDVTATADVETITWQGAVYRRDRGDSADQAVARVRAVINERRLEVAERETDGMLLFGTPGASWCDAVTVTCDRIEDALKTYPEPGLIRCADRGNDGPSIDERAATERTGLVAAKSATATGPAKARRGTKAKCRHCGEQIVYGPYFGWTTDPDVWSHTAGPKTCSTRPKEWDRNDWPTAEPEPNPQRKGRRMTDRPEHKHGPVMVWDCPGCVWGIKEDLERTQEQADAAEQRAKTLAATLDEVLRHFVHKGHPGEPCLSSGWISEKTVARWRAALYPPQSAAPDAGPSVREATANDRRWWDGEKTGEQ